MPVVLLVLLGPQVKAPEPKITGGRLREPSEQSPARVVELSRAKGLRRGPQVRSSSKLFSTLAPRDGICSKSPELAVCRQRDSPREVEKSLLRMNISNPDRWG